jgi:subfamily B ATP-binding cassette protein HlyB/CyaB
MSEDIDNSCDSGLVSLVLLLRFHGVSADPSQIGHRLGSAGVGIPEMLRCARELGLKARAVASEWSRLGKATLPAIAQRSDGGFFILGRLVDDKALVQDPSNGRPRLLSRAEFEAIWTCRLVVMTRRARLSDLVRQFDVTWFLQAMHKYRGI